MASNGDKEPTKLSDLESKIKAIARRFSSDVHEIENLEQEGRLVVWRILENNPNSEIPYLMASVKNRYLVIKRDQRAQKRGGGKRQVSFHRQDEEDFGPEDYVSRSGDISSIEKVEFLKETMRKIFGRCYMKKIKKNHRSFPQKIVRGLVESVWGFDLEDIPRKVDYQLFVDSKMTNFLWAFYRNSPMRAIQDAYPGRFFEWEFNRVSNGFWDGEEGYKNAVEAVRWLCQKKGYFGGKGKIPLNHDDFEEHGLGRAIELHFNHSPIVAVRTVFPELKIWQAQRTPSGYYDNPENGRIALSFLLQDIGFPLIGELTPEEIYDNNPRRIRKSHFEERGLRGLLSRHGNCVYNIFNSLYPEKVYPWFFTSHHIKPHEVKDMATKAVRWLFEDYLKIPKSEISLYATQNLFWRVGFSGLLTKKSLGLRASSYAAVDLAYPGEFSKSDFDRHREIRTFPGLKDFRGKYERKNKPK